MKRGLYFEELVLGKQYRTTGITVTEDAIIRFALVWDSQPFHVDAVAAKDSIFGGLVSSGLQTLMLSYKLYYEHGLLKGTAIAGLGFDEMRFLKPLRPGDTIRVDYTIGNLKPSSKPGQGIVRVDLAAVNQNGDVILTVSLTALVASRPARA